MSAPLPLRRIGSLEVPILGLGVGNVTDDNHVEVERLLATAVEHGVGYVDISNRPASTERYVGAALRGHRDDVVVATKFGSRPRPGVLADASPAYVTSAVEASLRHLDTDRIDLLLLHRPDPATPIADTLAALDGLVREGKLREIGCSKFSAAQLREAHDAVAAGAARFVAVENPCNLLQTGDVDTVLPWCAATGAAYLAYWPLAAGLLTGKYRRGSAPPEASRFASNRKWTARADAWLTDSAFDVVERLQAWAADHGRTLVELAFAWLVAHPGLAVVIAGASSPEQLAANVAAAGAWTLTADERNEVTALARTAAAQAIDATTEPSAPNDAS